MRRILFFGGNGHCAARLAAARAVARFEILDVPYPGFEGRPRAASLEEFLDGLQRAAAPGDLAYASGIGAILLLCLRARGVLLEVPSILQAPVLWGLERRWMPRIVRHAPFRWILGSMFAWGPFQRRFARRHLRTPPSPETLRAFFAGYASCASLPDLFAWIGPPLLRRLEADFRKTPRALDRIAVWWGEEDRVVGLDELAWTESALGVRWPVRRFPGWGHYPMIDSPAEWAAAIESSLA